MRHADARPARGLLLSGVSAGLDLGFSLLMMGIALTIVTQDAVHPLVQRLLLATAYSVGFLFVNLGRSELFTEHTTLMVFPVLHRTRTVGALLRSWALVYAGNLITKGVDPLAACRVALVRPITDDPDMRDALDAAVLTFFN